MRPVHWDDAPEESLGRDPLRGRWRDLGDLAASDVERDARGDPLTREDDALLGPRLARAALPAHFTLVAAGP